MPRLTKKKSASKKPTLQKIKVWTLGYSPFIMGGNVNAPIMAEVEALGPFDLGKGYSGYLVTSPTGKTFVAESETGAFVGPDIESVRADVRDADPKVMWEQVEEAKKLLVDVRYLSPKEFWSMFRK